MNCAGLLESELFGHVKGPYRDKRGKLELGDRGSCFSTKSARWASHAGAAVCVSMETGELQEPHVDLRVIAATNAQPARRDSQKAPLFLPPQRHSPCCARCASGADIHRTSTTS